MPIGFVILRYFAMQSISDVVLRVKRSDAMMMELRRK
jgi:hypothetical protein